MAYKLGKGYKPYMTNGSIRTKFRFSQEAGDSDFPWENDANNGNK